MAQQAQSDECWSLSAGAGVGGRQLKEQENECEWEPAKARRGELGLLHASAAQEEELENKRTKTGGCCRLVRCRMRVLVVVLKMDEEKWTKEGRRKEGAWNKHSVALLQRPEALSQ